MVVKATSAAGLNASNQHRYMNVLAKDVFGAKVYRKRSLVRNFMVLVILGICCVSMCLMSVDHKYLPWKISVVSQHPVPGGGTCHRDFSASDVPLHYPQPRTYDRGECACTPVHYFVILSMQRSGSGWFETLLNNHPNISSHGEIFSMKQRHTNFSTIVKTLDTVYNLEWSSSAAKNECTAAVGFKWMLNQGVMEYNRETLEYFMWRGVSVVFLLRWNTLRRLVSILANAYDRDVKQLNGSHKSHVHSKEEANTLALYKPAVDVTFLLDKLKRVQEITWDALRFFNSTRHKVVYYEDLVRDQKTILEVQQFLGVPAQNLRSQHVKIHTKPLSSQISNWDAVYKRLKGTAFEVLLNSKDYRIL